MTCDAKLHAILITRDGMPPYTVTFHDHSNAIEYLNERKGWANTDEEDYLVCPVAYGESRLSRLTRKEVTKFEWVIEEVQ